MADATKTPRARRALLRVGAAVGRRALSLCWATYVLGVLWVLLHPAVTVSTGELKCRGTYMSENALLIDQIEARSGNKEVQAARTFHRTLAELARDDGGCGANCSHVVDWIYEQLGALNRVDAYKQKFWDPSAGVERTNIYGILRASPLADGKESLVLVAHYRNAGRANGETSSVAMGLALLQYLAQAKWLAKDIVLLVADDGKLDGTDGFAPGTDAWLRAYHLNPTDIGGVKNTLVDRAGLIRAAISIESLPNTRAINAAGIYAAGTNGQLPNLDLINTAVRALRQQGIPAMLDRRNMKPSGPSAEDRDLLDISIEAAASLNNAMVKTVIPENEQAMRDYITSLGGMLRFMKTLATGPSGLHASFIGYNIDAITLSFDQERSDTARRHVTIRDSLRAIELVVRALSNLEEKLHQSFFLYVLPSPTTFVSVGEYYYPVALAVSPAIAHLLTLASKTVGMRIAFALVSLVIVEALCGLLLIALAPVLKRQQWLLLLAVTAVELIIVSTIRELRSLDVFSGCTEIADWKQRVQAYEAEANEVKSRNDAKEQQSEQPPFSGFQDSGWRALKLVTMALLVYAHCILGILNYPMALFCAIFTAHFARIVPASTVSFTKNLAHGAWLLVSSPLALFAVANIVDYQGSHEALLYLVNSFSSRINLLALPYVCLLYVPVHAFSLVIWLFDAHPRASTTRAKQDCTLFSSRRELVE